MRSYIRETVNLGHGKKLITHYTPGEYLIGSIIKFFLYLFIVWPFELILTLLMYFFAIVWLIIKLPFILLGKIFRSIFHR